MERADCFLTRGSRREEPLISLCPYLRWGFRGALPSEDQWHAEEVLTWKAMEFAIVKKIRRGSVAL